MTPKPFTQICYNLQFSHVAVLKKKTTTFHFKIPDGRVTLFHLNNFPCKSQNPLRSCQMLMAIRIRSLLETTLLSLVLPFLPPTYIHQTHLWAFPRIYSFAENLLLIYGCRIFPNDMEHNFLPASSWVSYPSLCVTLHCWIQSASSKPRGLDVMRWPYHVAMVTLQLAK